MPGELFKLLPLCVAVFCEKVGGAEEQFVCAELAGWGYDNCV